MCNINRRNFLKGLGASSLLFSELSLLPLKSMAQFQMMDVKTNFVVFRVIGGMDSMLGLHPVIENSNLPQEELYMTYDPRTEVQRNVSGTPIHLGPSAASLKNFVRDMIVIRGVVMGASDIGHPAAIHHISSGKAVDTAPHVSAIISQELNGQEKFFVTNSLVQKTAKQTFSTVLTNSLNGVNFNHLPTDSYSNLMSVYRQKDDSLKNFLRFLSQRGKLNLFQKVVEESQAKSQPTAQDTYGAPDSSGPTVNPENFVLASFASEFSQVAQVDLIDESKNLDTHGGHSLHKEYQKVRWDRIATFMENLKRYSLWDNTVVMVISEFNRSPGMNSTAGKDHNINDNTVALFGGALNGGRVYGDHQFHPSQATKTTSLWTGSYLNYKTGSVENISTLVAAQKNQAHSQLPKHIDLIRPENVWGSVLDYFASSSVKDIGTDLNLIPGLFKK